MQDNSEQITKLDGLTLREVFWNFILSDPDIHDLCWMVEDPNIRCVPLWENQLREMSRVWWPINYRNGDFTGWLDDFLQRVVYPESKSGPRLIFDLDKIVGIVERRYIFLIESLREGLIVAQGKPFTGGAKEEILRAFWSGEMGLIDFANSKVFCPNSKADQWTYVGLRLPLTDKPKIIPADSDIPTQSQNAENLHLLIYDEISAMDDPEAFFKERSSKIRFAESLALKFPRYKLESIKRTAGTVRRELGIGTEQD